MEKCAVASATTACPTTISNPGALYWRGTGSDTLAETDLAGNDQEEYIFFNGQRIARRDTTASGTTVAVHYYFSDHLGSHGVVENATGTVCEQDIDYFPYGDIENDYCPNVSQNYKFTAKERDAESGLDHFGARYNSSSLGRFMTPDWAAKPTAVPYAMFGDPQSLNLYAYIRNNPLATVDVDGHCPSDNPNCNNVKVSVDKPVPEMKFNAKSANGPVSGPGVQTTLTFTENGKPISNMTVNENPKSTDNLSGKPVKAPAGTGTTNSQGTMKDNVIAPMTDTPISTRDQKEQLTNDSLGNAYSHTVEQALTFTTPSGAACQAAYTETLQNTSPDNDKFNDTNANGVDFTFTDTDPVVSPSPQKN